MELMFKPAGEFERTLKLLKILKCQHKLFLRSSLGALPV